MSVPFTQYHRPNGTQTQIKFERHHQIEGMAQELIEKGYTFSCELVNDKIMSFTVGNENGDIACRLSRPDSALIGSVVDLLIGEAHNIAAARYVGEAAKRRKTKGTRKQ